LVTTKMHGFCPKLFTEKCCLSLFERKGPSQLLENFFLEVGEGSRVNLLSCIVS
jgi:hypothetical protein